MYSGVPNHSFFIFLYLCICIFVWGVQAQTTIAPSPPQNKTKQNKTKTIKEKNKIPFSQLWANNEVHMLPNIYGIYGYVKVMYNVWWMSFSFTCFRRRRSCMWSWSISWPDNLDQRLLNSCRFTSRLSKTRPSS